MSGLNRNGFYGNENNVPYLSEFDDGIRYPSSPLRMKQIVFYIAQK
jgi:hypothetical protein